MRNFTDPLKIEAVRQRYKGWRHWIPPGWYKQQWKLLEDFTYVPKTAGWSGGNIKVEAGFAFDGASVPFGPSLFVPRTHSNYIQAAALHDWLYSYHENRKEADDIFYEALGELGMSDFWRRIMWMAVRLFGSIGKRQKYLR